MQFPNVKLKDALKRFVSEMADLVLLLFNVKFSLHKILQTLFKWF